MEIKRLIYQGTGNYTVEAALKSKYIDYVIVSTGRRLRG